MREAAPKNRAEFEIARYQAEAGDFVGAHKTAGLIGAGDPSDHSSGLRMISKAETEDAIAKEQSNPANNHARISVAVSDWIRQNDSIGLLNKPIHTDLAAYLRSLPSTDSAQLVTALEKSTTEIIDCGRYLDLMLKRLAKTVRP